MIAVILAAGMAKRLRPLTDNTPKCLLQVGEKCLLQRSVDALRENGINDFVIVTGYLHEMIEEFMQKQYGNSIHVTYLHNKDFETTNNIFSLWLTREETDGRDFLLLDSDLLYDSRIVKSVLAEDSPNVLTVIKHELGEEEVKVVINEAGNILEINKTCNPSSAIGESLGIEKMGKTYSEALFKELEIMITQEHLDNVFYERAFERLLTQGHTFKILDATKYFSCELDTVEDFENAKQKIPAELY